MAEPNYANAYLRDPIADNAVALVTSRHRNDTNVLTVSFFAESSHIPPLVRVSIAQSCWAHELIAASGWFGLSVLAQGQEELALQCGTGSGKGQSRFVRFGIQHWFSPHGVPLLERCLTTSECQVRESVEVAGHTIFVAELIASYRQTAWAGRDALLLSDLARYVRPQ